MKQLKVKPAVLKRAKHLSQQRENLRRFIAITTAETEQRRAFIQIHKAELQTLKRWEANARKELSEL